MSTRIAIVYNKPDTVLYQERGEAIAVLGVLDCVDAVEKALKELGYDVVLLPLSPPVTEIKDKLLSVKTDIIFNLFEGFEDSPETEALVPEAAEKLGIPYTGCPSSTLRLALDKGRAKAMMKAAGIRTADFQVLNPSNIGEFHLKYPCIVKPRGEDASHGLSENSVVHDAVGLARQVELMCSVYKNDALVEEFIGGREFNATGMGNSIPIVLPASEIEYHLPDNLPRLLTFSAKWEEETVYFKGTKPVCPAPLTPTQRRQVIQTVVRTYRLFGCRGYARVDMRMDANGYFNVIELNPNPDITPGNGTARHAEATGWMYNDMIARIVQLAIETPYAENTTDATPRQVSRDDDSAQYARIPAP
jgi:D-alanine-D-alanine ligase